MKIRNKNYGNKIDFFASQRGASDSITDFSVLSNPVDAHNVSSLGLCGGIFAWKALLNMAGYFQPSVVSIYIINK